MGKRTRNRAPHQGLAPKKTVSVLRPTTIFPSKFQVKRVDVREVRAKQQKEAGKGPQLSHDERESLKAARAGKKTVIIMGWAEKSRDYVPWDDLTDGVEVWGLNEAYNDPQQFIRMDKVTGWFQIHPEWDFRRANNHNDEAHLDWLTQAHPFPIWMQEVYPYIPSAKQYPLEEIIAKAGGEQWRDFQSTAACEVAMAWYLGFERIELYGIEMTGGTDYIRQRANLDRWLGFAMGSGIEVYAPPASDIFARRQLYGFEQQPRVNLTHIELKRQAYQKLLADAENEMRALDEERKVAAAKLASPGINPGERSRLQELVDALSLRLIVGAGKAGIGRGGLEGLNWVHSEVRALGESYLRYELDPDGKIGASLISEDDEPTVELPE